MVAFQLEESITISTTSPAEFCQILNCCPSTGKAEKKGPEEAPEFKNIADQLTKSSSNIALGVGIAFLALTMRNLTRPDTQEISFQHFKTQLLAKDVVDRIEVANKTTAKVCHLRHGFGLMSWDCCHICYVVS